ncbi:hypothetical protein ACSBR1_027826 [Camellia fascicularis]
MRRCIKIPTKQSLRFCRQTSPDKPKSKKFPLIICVQTTRLEEEVMSDYPPEEVWIHNILSTLPIKTLLRCTSVCKSWVVATTEAQAQD